MTGGGVGGDSCHAKCGASHPPVGRTVTLSSETDTWYAIAIDYGSLPLKALVRLLARFQWLSLPIALSRGAGCTWRTPCSNCSQKATTLCPSPDSPLCALSVASTCALCTLLAQLRLRLGLLLTEEHSIAKSLSWSTRAIRKCLRESRRSHGVLTAQPRAIQYSTVHYCTVQLSCIRSVIL